MNIKNADMTAVSPRKGAHSVESRTSERLPGACYAQRVTRNNANLLRSISSARNINMRTATQAMPDTGGSNVNTNALNAVSRCPKENIILAALRAEKCKASGRKKNEKRKRPSRAATPKRSM